jgi:hypothetical protein
MVIELSGPEYRTGDTRMSDGKGEAYWRRQAALYRALAGEDTDVDVVEREFPDNGPTSPINIALAIQAVINAARHFREKNGPDNYYKLIEALGDLDQIEEQL